MCSSDLHINTSLSVTTKKTHASIQNQADTCAYWLNTPVPVEWYHDSNDSPVLIFWIKDQDLGDNPLTSLQNIQRFPGSGKMAELGFVASKYMNADVVLDGGIGGNIPRNTGYFLNSKYIFFRPHVNRNFVPIGDERMSTNQDAIVRLIGWAGNMTASGLQFQGVMTE